MSAEISLVVAFSAGLVSFFSPCFFPVLPGFFALMATRGGEKSGTSARSRLANVYVSLAFIAGFTAVFLLISAAFQSSLEYSGLFLVRKTLATVGGMLIIAFGLVMMGVVPEKWTNKVLGGSRTGGRVLGRVTTYLTATHGRARVLFRGGAAFFFGAGFAAAWSPCIGAVLGAVLSLTLTQPGQGLVLFGAYICGFGIPLIALGIFASEASRFVERFTPKTFQIQSIFGALLVVAGMFMLLFPPEEVLKCF